MRLSSDYTWPLLPHAAALDLRRALGCDGVDVGFMGQRSDVRPEQMRESVVAAADVRKRAGSRGLVVADVFAIPFTGFETKSANNPDAPHRARSDWLDCTRVDTVGGSALLRDMLLAAARPRMAGGAR